jgi:hypothetical protein
VSVFPILLLACSETQLRPGGKDAQGDDDDDVPLPSLSIRAALAFDPLFGEASLEIEGPPEQELTVEIRDPEGELVRELEGETDDDGRLLTAWDGRTAEGAWTVAGRHELVVSAGGQEAEVELFAVRVGMREARLDDDGGVSATREPLYWPVERELQSLGEPVAGLSSIDDGEIPLDFEAPVVPLQSATRPDRAEPAAYVFDSRPLLALTVGEQGALGSSGLDEDEDEVEIELAVDGWTVLSGNPLRPGTEVVLQLDEPLGETVGVSALELQLRFELSGAPLGEQVLPLRIYRLLDVSQFDNPADKYRPWVPVVDQAMASLDGTPAQLEPVLDGLAAFVYYDLGLQYDTQAGASSYSEYVGFDWDEPHFYLSDFLQRSNGSVINCSDAGNILGAYANMVGARLEHVILDPSFDLNYILAIGGSEFTSCPFGPWGCGFSYHAVTTSPDSGAIWDATLALDGDGDPGEAPHLEKLVHHVPAEEYLDELVRAGQPNYHSSSQETLQ